MPDQKRFPNLTGPSRSTPLQEALDLVQSTLLYDRKDIDELRTSMRTTQEALNSALRRIYDLETHITGEHPYAAQSH